MVRRRRRREKPGCRCCDLAPVGVRSRQLIRSQSRAERQVLMPSRLPEKLTFVLAALLVATPGETSAQPYRHWGGYRHWSGYGAYPVRYRAYGGHYPAYVGYRGYYGYPGHYGYHHHGNDAWIAVGAGALGIMLGSIYAYRYAYPRVVYVPVAYPPPAPAPAVMQQCPDGSTIPAGSYCPSPPPAAAPLPPPPLPSPERG